MSKEATRKRSNKKTKKFVSSTAGGRYDDSVKLPSGRFQASRGQLAHFEDMMDPTSRHLAEVKYMHLVLDPKNADLTGVPLALGGVPPESVKVRMTLGNTMTVGLSGDLAVALYSCGGVPERDFPDNYDGLLQNLLPKQGYLSGVLGYREPIICGGYLTGVTPVIGVSKGSDSVAENQMGVPNPGITLNKAVGRVVSQEFVIYPTGSLLTTKGLATAVTSRDSMSDSLNGVSAAGAFALQNVDRNTFPLANWEPDHRVRFVRAPSEQADINLLPTDFSRVLADPGGGWNQAGSIWGAFFAQGCDPGQTFRVECTVVYEFASSSYAMATKNMTSSNSGAGLTMPGTQALPPGVYPEAVTDKIKAGALAHNMAQEYGNKHAAGFGSILSKAGGVLGDVAKKVLPSLLGLAVSALSEGVIPPSVGISAGNALGNAMTITSPHSGVEPLMLGPAPTPYIIPEREPISLPTSIHEVDLYASRQSPGPSAKEGSEIPALPPTPPTEEGAGKGKLEEDATPKGCATSSCHIADCTLHRR